MTQVRGDPSFKRAFGQRLKVLVDLHLNLNWAELAKKLGYKNSSALRQARDGNTLLSAEKLALLGELNFGVRKRKISLDWLLTGRGEPLTSISINHLLPMTLEEQIHRASPEAQAKISAYLEILEKVEDATQDNEGQ